MPWNGTTLYLAELDDQGSLIDARIIAGGVAEIRLPARMVTRRRKGILRIGSQQLVT